MILKGQQIDPSNVPDIHPRGLFTATVFNEAGMEEKTLMHGVLSQAWIPCVMLD